MNKIRKSPGILRKTIQTQSVYNIEKLDTLKQFFNGVQHMKKNLLLKRQNNTSHRFQHTTYCKTNRTRSIKRYSVLPQIMKKDVFKQPSRSYSRQQNKTVNLTYQKVQNTSILNGTNQSNNPTVQVINYYKRFILPTQLRISLEPRDVYLSISRINKKQFQKRQPINSTRHHKSKSVSNSFKQKKQQTKCSFGQFNKPWNQNINLKQFF